jgi:xanthine dehydrogenase accessory factor
MSKELEIWQFAAGKLERGEIVMMVVVAESSGSSPGRQGFKMIVAENDLRGSIGGGLMEIR